jgi:GMP synthase-like glutamine amidotransferase
MGALEDTRLPRLAAERTLIGDAVRAGLPCWGVCLGAQLLAAALGARVYSGPRPEVGLHELRLTQASLSDPIFAGFPVALRVPGWHRDTFDLPEGAVLLAGSPAYPHQVFRWGIHAYGVQFHAELVPEMVREWASVPSYAAQLESALGYGAESLLIQALERAGDDLRLLASTLLRRWLRFVSVCSVMAA